MSAAPEGDAVFPERWTIGIAGPVTRAIDRFVAAHGAGFQTFGRGILWLLLQVEGLLRGLPWWSVVLVITALAYALRRRWTFAAGLGFATALLGLLGLWDAAMQTLALMIVALAAAILIGLPLGVGLARAKTVRVVARPLLDAMQTLPSFVYLVPALMLFGLGKVPALLATVVYALPPLVRLTELGVRQADPEAVEAAEAFGAAPLQRLFWVELPLAWPSVLLGINQACMMALSMVVVAAMIGARGLGEQVLLGIQRLDTGKALVAGLAIVALAVVLDRLTQAIARVPDPDGGP